MMDGLKNAATHISNKIGLTTSEKDSAQSPLPEPVPPHHQSEADQQTHQQSRSRSRSFTQPSPHVSVLVSGKHGGVKPSDSKSAYIGSKSLPNGPTIHTTCRSTQVIARLSPLQELEKRNGDLLQELKQAADTINKCQQTAMAREQERDSVRAHADALQKELNTIRKQEEARMKDYQEMKALLEARRKELQDAQRFMGTSDTVSESEIVQQVRDLNTEIFNLAQSMSDAKPRTGDLNKRSRHEAVKELSRIFDNQFLNALSSVDPQGDTILLEIAIQAAASVFLSWVISTWTASQESDAMFRSVYKRIKSSENQSVAGQWRALTRKSTENKYLRRKLREDHLDRDFTGLLTHSAALSHVRFSSTAHGRAVQLMIAKALKIRHLIGEAIVSSDYEIVVPDTGTAFSMGDMNDAYKPRELGPRAAGSSVLCCISLGLKRIEKVRGELQVTTLVKADVGLETLMDDLGLEVDGSSDNMSTSSEL